MELSQELIKNFDVKVRVLCKGNSTITRFIKSMSSITKHEKISARESGVRATIQTRVET